MKEKIETFRYLAGIFVIVSLIFLLIELGEIFLGYDRTIALIEAVFMLILMILVGIS